jgi:ATP-dependent Clp endopeptidase proteolytic subunit ClpP
MALPPLVEATTRDLADVAGLESGGDVFQRLLRERIVFLGTEVNQASANQICAQLLLLAAEDPERDISFIINSPGGSIYDGLAIYDTMQYVSCDVSTIAIGMAASMAQFLLPSRPGALVATAGVSPQPDRQGGERCERAKSEEPSTGRTLEEPCLRGGGGDGGSSAES